MNLEAAFLEDIREHPDDASLWLILADWLEDQADPRAELVRLTQALRTEPRHADFLARQRRMQELLGNGVLPVVPAITNSIGMRLALIPAGSFIMGSPSNEPHHERDESPRRPVRIARHFYISVYPVTQVEYERVMDTNPSDFRAPNYPVEQVSWIEATRFCEVLTSMPTEQAGGWTYWLPTEAEWEYACRAGTTTPYHFGAEGTLRWGNYDLSPRPPGGSAPLRRTNQVGLYTPNAWGLYDLHGNVWEWCEDWFAPYASGKQVDPRGPDSGMLRAMRGGGWNSYPQWCRSARRSNTGPDSRARDRGFRVIAVRGRHR